MQIPVVDIFAGPGGLGEGFSGYVAPNRSRPFRIAVSAEMDRDAWETLRLRAFYRQYSPGRVPQSYYDYVAGRAEQPFTTHTKEKWEAAGREARQLTLGEPDDDLALRERITATTNKDEPWILIGGPPCQAYSLVGRARNRGIADYRPENDRRYKLYQHYLALLSEFRPAAFVMENVKGLLSAKVDGKSVFDEIAEGLQLPGGRGGPRYRLIPLVEPKLGVERGSADPRSYVLRAEAHGVPQARHRVILFGIREDMWRGSHFFLSPSTDRYSVYDVIEHLPALRSGLTDMTVHDWPQTAASLLQDAARKVVDDKKVATHLQKLAKAALKLDDPGSGGSWMPRTYGCDVVPQHLEDWLIDERLDVLLNHEVRDHNSLDLQRYAYVSAFGEAHERSPRGAAEFPEKLHPNHKNWKSGKFVDRFKVQLKENPSLTVTSHLSKDGHYFIHPDTSQLRSLSVREAARLQTFPDNYYFEGGRSAQFRQVGNAVPPWLARQIADVVHSYLRS